MSSREDSGQFQEIVNEMVRRIAETLDPVRIVIFGSHARGDARPDSDVDFLVITDRDEPRRKQAVRAYQALVGTGLAKDIVVVTLEDVERWRDVPGTIIAPALREGVVAYDRSA